MASLSCWEQSRILRRMRRPVLCAPAAAPQPDRSVPMAQSRPMTWNLIRLSDAPATPWRNGGGLTRELAAWPEGPDWTWRISVADVAADGPFSHFPGVQRFFAVLDGNGVRLTADGRPHEVTATSAPLAFDGAATVDCQLLAGPTQDLNLMVQRSRASGAMTRLAGVRQWVTAAEVVVAVYALEAPAVV